MAAEDEDRKRMVARMARYLGCRGTHRSDDGELMPCSSNEELVRISRRAEPKKKDYITDEETPKRRRKKKGRRRRDHWEELGGRGPVGIDTLPGGGLVSAAVGAKQAFVFGRAKPRLGDQDVFTNPHSARLRARQLGCIGIARRSTPEGDVVWTPCTNVSDYRRRLGIGPQAARDRRRQEDAMLRRLRRRMRGKAAIPIDGDGDGKINDGEANEMPAPIPGVVPTVSRIRSQARSALDKLRDIQQRISDDGDAKKSKRKIRRSRDSLPDTSAGGLTQIAERLRDPDGGFTIGLNQGSDVRSGWAIARNGNGVTFDASEMFDEDGNVKPGADDLVLAFITLNKDDLLEESAESGHRVALGGWHNPEDGKIYLDITDVYSKSSMSKEDALKRGKDQDQISIADLDLIRKGVETDEWDDDAFLDADGTGQSQLDNDRFQAVLSALRQNPDERPDRPTESRQDDRVVTSDDGVPMMFGEPQRDLAAKHGVEKDWSEVRAVDPERRKEISDFYADAPDPTAEEISEEVREAYEALTLEVEQQFEMLTKELGVNVEFVDEDPYENYFEMLRDFQENRRLKIMRTETTGSHPFFTDEQNDKFRAVHDAFGHLATGRGFDRHGEEAAYQAHRSMFSETAASAAATELRGQNSYLIQMGEFGPQKLILLPTDLRKRLYLLLGLKAAEVDRVRDAQVASDQDNAYEKTGSHHVSLGRVKRGE